MATDLFIAEHDIGPTTCSFWKTYEKLQKDNDIDVLLSGAKGSLLQQAVKLEGMLRSVSKKLETTPSARHDIVKQSVVKWIYFTNKLEFAGAPSEGDTESVLKAGLVSTKADVEVISTYNLLTASYKTTRNVKEKSFDEMALKKWHQILFLATMPNIVGKFRTTGCQTMNLDGSQHMYPHHNLIPIFIKNFCELFHKLCTHIQAKESKEEPAHHLLSVFALAAFAQFHFVDIHPFQDGNGRLCRFLSKYILDAVLPFPIPMFENRNDYLNTLISGRKELDPYNAPKELCELLLKTAIDYYLTICVKLDTPVYNPILAANDDELTECMDAAKLTFDVRHAVVAAFKNLLPGQKKIISLQCDLYSGIEVCKYEKIDFETL